MNNPLCPGSGVLIQPMTQSVMCYCGVTFKRRLRSLHQWVIPSHPANMTGIYNISHYRSVEKDLEKGLTK